MLAPSQNYLTQFAENGHRVFLVHHMERDRDGKKICGCGHPKCTATGKHPVSSNWQNTPEWDEDQIETMQEVVRDGRGYGVLCDRLMVIDVDNRNGGASSYEKLVEAFPEITGSGLVVETGRGDGSKHLYFTLPPAIKVRQVHPDYPGIDFKHSGFVIGPGSPHEKGNKYRVVSGSVHDIDTAPAGLVDFLKKPPTVTVEYEGNDIEVSDDSLRSMLSSIPDYEEYQTWLEVGMALHHTTSGNGVALWHEWSKQSSKYEPEELDKRWHGFGKAAGNPVRIGTLIKMAKDNGWIEPVTMDGSEPVLQGWFAQALTGDPVNQKVTDKDIKGSLNPLKKAPIDISRVDLTKPPGFVGEVAVWINSQSMFPRHNLAAVAALFAVGNVAGLRYMEDSPSATRTNLAIFCVAGSGTGKDAILSAVREIHQCVDIDATQHGNIKSDREMYQNLVRHQASIYTVDEIGGRLSKISNSRKGGAVHLDGIMETFMDIYTKSHKAILLTGDAKVEVEKFLLQRAGELRKIIEENEDKFGRAERELISVEKRLGLRGRIENPFLSLIGFTTPRQFSDMMTVANVETGFLGRTIMCVEPDINPYPDFDFASPPMPPEMQMRLRQIAWGGNASPYADSPRVEAIGEMERVGVTPEAKELLVECSKWIWKMTQAHIETSGGIFTPLYRRAFEKVVKAALVLGVADGEISVEYVQWALALSLRDMEEKMSAVMMEDETFSKTERLTSTVTKAIRTTGGGQSLGVLCGRANLRKYRQEDVLTILKGLVEKKIVRVEMDKDGRSGKDLPRYYPCTQDDEPEMKEAP